MCPLLARHERHAAPHRPDQFANNRQTNTAPLARQRCHSSPLKALELQIETGKYLPRDAYREATATVLATLAQSMRSIPDTLERKHGLPPEALKYIEDTIDEQLSSAAATLALFAGTGA